MGRSFLSLPDFFAALQALWGESWGAGGSEAGASRSCRGPGRGEWSFKETAADGDRSQEQTETGDFKVNCWEHGICTCKYFTPIVKAYECMSCLQVSRSQTLLFFQDFEEQLDQKDRLIKKLQNQIHSLVSSQKGNVGACSCDLSNKSNSNMLITSLFLTQPRKCPRPLFLKITSACWSSRERMNPCSSKTSSLVSFPCFYKMAALMLYLHWLDPLRDWAEINRQMYQQ